MRTGALRKVVITSIGVFSSLGFESQEIVQNIKHGRVSFEKSPHSDGTIICPITGFDLKKIIGSYKDQRYLNRGAQYSVAAAVAAVKNSGLNQESLKKTGLFVGVGPNLDIGGECPEIHKGTIDNNKLKALWMLRFLPNTAAAAISRLTGIHGENFTITTACAASLQAIGEAFRKVRDGYLDMAFAGGGDSRLSPAGLMAYQKAQALYKGWEEPERASRPFDETRQGFIPGEGGAFFLLEELKHAQKRGATIYGEICGFGSSMDGYNMTAPEPNGRLGEIAVRAALKDGNLLPGEIDMISAHGTSTILNDAMEGNLIERIYEEKPPLVMALKSWIGHLSAACGAVELAICLSLMRAAYIPEIRNLERMCNPRLNLVKEGRNFNWGAVLLENFGFGGQNSALILKKI